MPTFLFSCPNHYTPLEFERVGSHKDPNPLCPVCEHETTRLIAGPTASRLLGCGWSNEGYASTQQGDQAMADRADRRGKIASFPGQKNAGSK